MYLSLVTLPLQQLCLILHEKDGGGGAWSVLPRNVNAELSCLLINRKLPLGGIPSAETWRLSVETGMVETIRPL